ncbi:MAG: oligosaccharide flippase family protein, partial [Nitrospiria bacterium]
FLTQGLTWGMRFLCGVLIARGLGPLGRGELTLAMWVPSLFQALFYFGLGEASISLLNRKDFSRRDVVGSLNVLALLLLALGGFFYFSLSPWILSVLQDQIPRKLYQQAFWLFPLPLFWAYWSANLLALGKVSEVNWGRVIHQGTLLVFVLIWFLWFSGQTNMALWAFISGAAAEIVFVVILLHRKIPFALAWNSSVIRQQFRLGGQVTLANWLDFLSRRLDILFVSFFGGVLGVGLYTIAVGLRDLALTLPQIFVRPVLSASARHPGTDGIPLIAKAFQQALLLIIPFGLALAFALPWLVNWIYSNSFAGAVAPARWLLLGFVALGLSEILTVGFIGFGQPKPVVLSQTISLACLLFLGFIFAPLWGISGIAMAVSLSQIMGLISLFLFLRWFYPDKFYAFVHAGWGHWRWHDLAFLWSRDNS